MPARALPGSEPIGIGRGEQPGPMRQNGQGAMAIAGLGTGREGRQELALPQTRRPRWRKGPRAA
eukprot:12227016-Alexandrium_andersonii.AAC.1